MAWGYWHRKHFVLEEGDTGSWVGEEWVGVGEEGVSQRWLGSGVAGGQRGEEAVVETGSCWTGLPFLALEEAVR